MKQYISHFSIDRQGNVTTDVAFDASNFEVKFDEDKQPALNSEIPNAIDNALSSHVNNKLEFVGQNIHSMFDDRISQIETNRGMKSIGISNGKHASTSSTDKTTGGSASEKIPTTIAMVTNSANQHSRKNEPRPHPTTLYSSTPNANTLYGSASSLQYIPVPPNFSQPYDTPTIN